MQGPPNERFRELCELAEVEDDPYKLADLADEIYEILELQLESLRKSRPNQPDRATLIERTTLPGGLR
jgi:hypothetical protein